MPNGLISDLFALSIIGRVARRAFKKPVKMGKKKKKKQRDLGFSGFNNDFRINIKPIKKVRL